MPFHSESPGVELDPLRVEGSQLSIERTLLVRDQGIVVSIRISPVGEPPIKYQFIDPLPAAFEIDELGFHPDFEPAHGRIDRHQIVVSGLLDSANAHVVKYGLCPASPQTPEAVESVQSANPPSIELEDRIAPEATDDVDFETPALVRGETANSGLYSSFKHSVFGSGEAAVPADTEPPKQVDTTESEAAAEAVAEAISDLEEAQAGGADATPNPESVEELFEQAESSEEQAATGPDASVERSLAQQEEAETPTNASVVDQLVTELRAAPRDDHQALADELTTILDREDPKLPRSTEVRLQQLESRMEEFSAYSAALRDLIDEHGTPSEFLTDINQDLEELRKSIAEVRTDIGQLDDEQAVISTDLGALEETVDRFAEEAADERSALESDLDDLEATIDDVETNAAESRETLRDDLESLKSDLDALDDTIGTLREAVEEGKARRQAIADALSGTQRQD